MCFSNFKQKREFWLIFNTRIQLAQLFLFLFLFDESCMCVYCVVRRNLPLLFIVDPLETFINEIAKPK